MKTTEQFALILGNDLVENYVNAQRLRKNAFADNVITYRSARKVLNYFEKAATFNEDAAIPDFLFIDFNLRITNLDNFLENFSKLPEKVISKTKIVVLSDLMDVDTKKRVLASPYVFEHFTRPLSTNNIEELKSAITELGVAK